MRVLLTGFEEYWDYWENSSWVVAKEVTNRGVLGAEIFQELLPVSFKRVAKSLCRAIEKHCPDFIIMLGQSGGSDKIKLERVALNLMDARLPDNDNYIPDEEPIYSNAPTALCTNVPIKLLCTTIKQQGIPVKVSNSCGLYVCNRTYYEALMACGDNSNMKALFIHLPYYEGQATAKNNKPLMALDDMVRAIQIIINEIYDK